MATAIHPPRVLFPIDYDARGEHEAAQRGYLGNVLVELEDGRSFALSFIDPVRLQQDLEEEAKLGRPYYSEPGLVVLPGVTRESIEATIPKLWEERFFEHVKPLPELAKGQAAKAGNIGDIFKHACLIALFNYLSRHQTIPVTYIESHSGYASYDMGQLRETANGEWGEERAWSLPRLLGYSWKNAGIRELAEIIRTESVYPGSPSLAMRFLPSSTRFVFYDLDPRAIRSIEQETKRQHLDGFACVHPSDGFLTVRQEVVYVRSRASERKTLAFLDPWYKARKADWANALDIAEQAGKEVAVLVWYPKRLGGKGFPSKENLHQLERLGAKWAELWFPDAVHFRKGPWAGQDLPGSGMFWVNVPELSKIAAEVGTELQEGFAGEKHNGRQLDLTFDAGG